MPYTLITLKPAQELNNILDVGFAYNQTLGVDTMYVLDQSSYLWGWGGAGNSYLTNASGHASSPILIINDRKYCRLGENGPIAFDDSSYAWTWGYNNNGMLGLNIPNQYVGVPSSVVGAKQWRTIVSTQNPVTMCGLDASSYAWGWGSGSYTGENTGINRSSPVSVVGGKQFIKIKAGAFYFLGLDSSSYAWGWGLNSSKQLGDTTILIRSSPVSVVGGQQFIDIFTNFQTSYALDSSSYLWAWGSSNNMQIGDGNNIDRDSPVKVDGPYDTLFVAQYTAFAKRGNYLFAWGSNTGYFGNSNTISSSYPFSLLNVKHPFTIKKLVGFGTIMALDTMSNVWCWGGNTYGSCGIGNTATQSYPVKPFIKPQPAFYSPMPTFPFIKVASADTNVNNCMFMLDASSYLWAWGANVGGWFGNNSNGYPQSPVSVVGNRRFRDVSVICNNSSGNIQVAALDLSSYLWCWGKDGSGLNRTGANGDNTTLDRSSPVSVVGGRQFIKILCHSYGTMALDSSSYLWNWGFGVQGEVGDATGVNRSSPVSVVGGMQAIDFTHSGASATLLDANGYAWSWGYNSSYGVLGNNTTNTQYYSPISVVGGRQFTQLAGYDIQTTTGICIWALDRSSYLWAWGYNASGQLGDGTTNTRSSPVSVIGGRQFIKIGQAWALDASSYLWGWGNNTYGQVGDGTINHKSSPVSVIGRFQFGSCMYNKWGVGVTSYPNSKIIIWGPTTQNRDLSNIGLTLSVPVMVTLQHDYPYIRPNTNYRNNILSK